MSSGIGVLVPVRDGAAHIATVLADLVGQTLAPDRILVVDDGSTDATAGIVRTMAADDDRIELVSSAGRGLAAALNLGLNHLDTAWVARADADDRYPAHRLAAQAAVLADDVVAVVGDYRISFEGRALGTIPCAVDPRATLLSLVRPVRFPHPAVVLRRDAVQAAGGYREDEFPAEDLGLWLRLAREGRMVGVPEVVLDYRWNATGVSSSKRHAQMSTTARLLTEVGLPAGAFDAAVEARSDVMRGYGRMSLTSRRRAAFAADLARAAGFDGRTRMSAIALGAATVARYPRSLAAGVALQRESRQRRTGFAPSAGSAR